MWCEWSVGGGEWDDVGGREWDERWDCVGAGASVIVCEDEVWGVEAGLVREITGGVYPGSRGLRSRVWLLEQEGAESLCEGAVVEKV